MTHNNPAVQEIMDTYTPVEVKKLIEYATDKQFVHHQKPEDIMKFYANHDMYVHHWLLDDTHAFRFYIGLQSAYNDANGYEGRMLQGRAASSAGESFRSQAELVAAMGDPRYDTDEAYRDDVLRRLDQSDLQF